MIYAFHLPLCNYGFWLPNDVRGSGSDFVRKTNLLPYGEAKKVSTRRSVAHRAQNYEIKRLARSSLTYPPVEFTGEQSLSCGTGIRRAVAKHGLTIWACCVQPDHIHLVVKRHHYPIEQVIRQIRTEMTAQLLADGLHPRKTEAFRASGVAVRGRCFSMMMRGFVAASSTYRTTRFVGRCPVSRGSL